MNSPALIAVALLASGCRGTPAPQGPSPAQKQARAAALAPVDIKASCDKRVVLSQCTDYAARAFAPGETFLEQPCAVMHGNFSPSACATAGLVGSCSVGSTPAVVASASEVRRFYAGGPNGYLRERAQRECQASAGIWIDLHPKELLP